MKKYIIHETTIATETNENYKNQTHTYLRGKAGCIFDPSLANLDWFIEINGYATKAAASAAMKKLNATYDWFENTFHTWTHVLQIVEFEVNC